MEKTLSVIIPVFNEEVSLTIFLPEVVQYCKLKQYKLILVNDGSTDNSIKIMEPFNKEGFVKIIENKVNSGYGASIKKAIRSAETDYILTIDSDGQHRLEEIERIFCTAVDNDAEMVVGNRGKTSGNYRSLGKWMIRRVAGAIMPLKIKDINSGMKLYDRELALKYLKLCPETMAYSDVILLAFVFRKHRVVEVDIKTNPRRDGKSTVNLLTAIDTMKEIINIIILFNPIRIFFPVGVLFISASILWEIPIFIRGSVISVGSMLGFVTGVIVLCVGLLAHQISAFRRESLD